ncbi:MAG: hypothetical protein F4Y50_03280 [Dehalococcoidia bacterium]|nr:hypothetical protein [Dehalococcoidia bacterium]
MLAVSLAVVVLGGLLACGQSENDDSTETLSPPSFPFDLSETGFHQSLLRVNSGRRVEVSVEVRQEKHDQHICGVPSVVDPFRNVLQTLTPRQNTEKETATHYVYESQYAFYAATDGMYGVKLENQSCALDDVAAVATVQWTIFPVQE